MTKTIRIVALVICAFPLGGVARAQSPVDAEYMDPQAGLSVDEAVRLAFEREPAYQAVRSDVTVALGQKLQAGLRPNPSLMIERREEPTGPDNGTLAQIQWPLDLFRRTARLAVADQQIAVAESAIADRARLLRAEVRIRYGNAAAAIQRLVLADRARELLFRQFGLVKARVDEGAAPPLEGDQLDVEVKRAEVEVLLMAADADAAMSAFKRAVGLPADAVVRLRDSLESLAMNPPIGTSSSASAIEERADVQMAQAATRAADARLAEARANGRFDVSLFGSYMRMDSTYPQFGVTADGTREPIHGVFHYVAAGATVALPLGNKNQGHIAVARAEQAGAAARFQAARLDAETEVAAAAGRLQRILQAAALYRGTVTLAEKNLDVVEQAYALGRATVNDVLAEQRRYLDVERGFSEALKALYDAQVALRVARGEP